MKNYITLLDILTKNKEKAIKLLEQFVDLKEKFGDLLTDNLGRMDNYSKELLSSISFELIERELISIESLKEYLKEKRNESIDFETVALLGLGYNKKSNKHEFAMRFLGKNNLPIKDIQMVILKGKLVEDNLHKAFADKELLILK